MAKTSYIELGSGEQIPILYEDRSVIAIDKPRGWMLVPFSWQKTDLNLQAAITSAIAEGQFWARSRNLKLLQHVHRLDACTPPKRAMPWSAMRSMAPRRRRCCRWPCVPCV